ncbi:MAG: SpoIIE family protein phosphatase [Nitrosospira sp.]|nr:SpoIIE family protein phosphatase [Nitrosospira sp.]
MEEMINLEDTQRAWPICHPTDVAAARRWGLRLSQSLGFNETMSGRVSLVITEAATNILKHATEGQLFLTRVRNGESNGIEILALDNGPGIQNLAYSLNDGVTTTSTPGSGLGALRRLSDSFDAYSAAGKGSAFYMCLWAAEAGYSRNGFEIGTVCVPMIHEEVCGDGWAVASDGGFATFLLADGLGHGMHAAHASRTARELLISRAGLQPQALMEVAHSELRGTRGAAIAVAQTQPNSEQLDFAGIGNISACVVNAISRKQLVSHNGIVGHNMRKVQQFTVPFPPGSLYIAHSDGISTRWDINAYPGLYLCHPALIAGIIFRDFVRGRDDASILVARHRL